MKQYVLFVGGTLVLSGGTLVLALGKWLPVYSGIIALGMFFLWSGILLMQDKHPEYQQWDKHQRRVYGLAFVVLGVLWSVISFTPLVNEWLPTLLTLIPPAVIALVGRRTYVERMRSIEYQNKQNEMKKDG